MKKVDWEVVIGGVAFSLFVLVCLVLVIVVISNIAIAIGTMIDAKSICLENGYPEIEHSNGRSYCIKRMDCEDIVVSVESLKARE